MGPLGCPKTSVRNCHTLCVIALKSAVITVEFVSQPCVHFLYDPFLILYLLLRLGLKLYTLFSHPRALDFIALIIQDVDKNIKLTNIYIYIMYVFVGFIFLSYHLNAWL